MTIRRGIHLYCDSSDVIHVERSVPTLVRSGAVGAVAMVEGITPGGSQRVPLDRVRRFVDAVRAKNITPTLCAFPDIGGDLIASRDHLAEMGETLRCAVQLDAEPRAGRHWTHETLLPWLSIAELTITTTRIEAPHLGPHNRTVFAQLEQQTSTATLSQALTIFSHYSPLENIVPVLGDFDQGEPQGGKRTLEELHVDLTRVGPQAKLAGALAVWSAHSTDGTEADALRDFAAATF
jgi:hypothetical protein